jgi:serine/threonine protein kinase/tetratricopeptide (TPR) repeat protein
MSTADAADLPSDIDTVDGHARMRRTAIDELPGRVGRYVILRRIGEGGMGVVLEAFDPELDRRVAIKLLQPTRVGSRASQRLLREAQVMARLSHPNVVQVYDAGVADQRVFLAMELVRGQTVRAWLDSKPRPWREILRRFVEAGRGMAAAHEAGIIHRDFKPENILIAENGRVRVADFGLANVDGMTHDSRPAEMRPRAESTLTSTGAVVGTPVYMAPEQHAGLDLDAAADQFSFCVALHEALFRQRPFEGTSAIQVAANVLAGRYVEPPRGRGVPRWVADVIRRGLSVERKDRWPDLPALLTALERDPGAIRRRWLTTATLAGTLGVSAWAIASRPEDAPCDSGREQMGAVWNDTTRTSIGESLESSARLDALAGQKVVEALDRYADDWVEAHHVTCMAHRDGEISSELLDTAMGCLQRRHDAIGRFVEILHEGEPAAIAGSPVAAVALPAVASCTDRRVLTTLVAPPRDPATAEAVHLLRRRLTQAEVTHSAGSIEKAQSELATIEREAAPLAYGPLQAEVALVIGRLAMERAEYPEAQPWLTQAASAGLAAGADAVAAEALARKLFADVMLANDAKLVMFDAPIAQGLVERLGNPPALAAMLSNNVGVLHAMDNDSRGAIEHFTHAIEMAADAPDVNPVDRAAYTMNLALQTPEQGQRDLLFDRAQAIVSQALGPNHLRTLEIAIRRADHTDDPVRALELKRETCSEITERMPDDYGQCHTCYWRLAELHEEVDQPGNALVSVRSAASCLDRIVVSYDGEYVEVQRSMTKAYEAVLEGRYDRALEETARAKRRLEPQMPSPWIASQLADVAVLEARSLVALGRGAEAAHDLDAAIAAYQKRAEMNHDRTWKARRERAERLRAAL